MLHTAMAVDHPYVHHSPHEQHPPSTRLRHRSRRYNLPPLPLFGRPPSTALRARRPCMFRLNYTPKVEQKIQWGGEIKLAVPFSARTNRSCGVVQEYRRCPLHMRTL